MLATDETSWFVSAVSTADGDKKKRQKGKGAPEPSVVLPNKLATLQVLRYRPTTPTLLGQICGCQIQPRFPSAALQ